MTITLPVVFRNGVFVPLELVDDIVEETTLQIDVHVPAAVSQDEADEKAYSFEERS